MTEHQKPNLLFVWNYLEWGGAQIYILAIIKEAVRDWKVTVMLPKKSSPDILMFIRETGAACEFIETHLDTAPAPGAVRKLARQWRRIHAEAVSFFHVLKYPRKNTVIHVETAPWQSWIYLTALALRGNVFVTVHNALAETSNWRKTIWMLRLMFLSILPGFHLMTANRDARESLKPFVTSRFYKSIKVTYASINPAEIDEVLKMAPAKDEILKRHQIPPGKPAVMCVGQFIDRKGRWIFLEAAEKILGKSADVIFIWLMPNLPDQEARRKIAKYQLKKSFFPVLSADVGLTRQEVLSFLTAADIFMLPSLYEGLPIALLEAMALRKPCIASKINSIPEAIEHLENGYLVEPGSVDDLIRALAALQADENMRNRLADKARLFVLENFDERVMAKKVIREYENCLK